MLGFMLKQSDSQIIFWFMHDVVAYGNYFLCLRLMKNPLIFLLIPMLHVDLGHMYIMPTMTTVGTYCILIISSFKNLTVKHQTKTTINHQNMF